MANEKHLYLTIQGSYKTNPTSLEMWQTGIRLALVFGDVDPIGTLPNNWAPAANPHTDSDTNWDASTNWVAAGPAAEDFDPLDYLRDQALPAVTTWMNQATIFNEAYLQNLRLYPIGTDGKAVPAPPYAAGSPAILTMKVNTVDGGAPSGGLLPLQLTPVVSLRTPQIGRRGRGRMYQPAPHTGMLLGSADPRIAASSVPTIANAAEQLVRDLTLTTVGTVRVVPIVTGAPWTAYASISTVKVGDLLDTQRRRRGNVPESYTTVSV